MLKTICLPGLALGLSLVAGAAQASDLIISEYIEGSSNNKAVEIYNGTGAAVDLSAYSLQVYFNGSDSAGANMPLSGSLADGDVYVLAHSSAVPEILAVADQLYGGGLFNGDDAVALVGPIGYVDVIGQIGTDPGSQWGNASIGTQNQTLRRNGDVTQGRSDGSTAFDPSIEWTSFGQDNFEDIGLYNGSPGDGNGDGGDEGGEDEVVELGQCGDAATLISAVQGSASASPVAGERVEIEAVVTADFRDSENGLSGFFVQEEDGDQDGQDITSEGLFVYDNGFDVDVQPGDLVRVGGVVSEYYDFTELTEIDGIAVCGSGYSVSPAQVSLPFTDAAEAERYEGMLAEFVQTLTVSENYSLGRYGELVLSSGRLFTPTNIVEPGPAAQAQQAANDLNRLVLDDGSTRQNPDPIPYPAPGLSAENSLRTGATLAGLRGVIGYSFGAYRVHPVEEPQFADTNPRSAAPELPGEGSLRVASFNVLNYFNGDGAGNGFPTPRGADTFEEFQRQRDKTINAILATGADVVGLMEMENDGYGPDSAIADLVEGLNTAAGSEVFQFVDPGQEQVGTDAIAVGILYRSDSVEPLGSAATIEGYPFDYGNRPPLLQAFTEIASGESFAVAVNHFRAKGSCPNDGSLNADLDDGQGCWNQTRVEAAQTLIDWLASDPAGTGVERTLIIGDLNSYARENPITTLADAGYANMLGQFQGEDTYGYVYQGQAGYLDHALASAALAPQVTGATIWHINADEPPVLDYNTEYKSAGQLESLYSASAYRASDHDPVLVELQLASEEPEQPGNGGGNGNGDGNGHKEKWHFLEKIRLIFEWLWSRWF
ncbi:ExeM/NucH family extracellular endonuclease [Microbulbifer celer]|uniref:ExeM/NucH family extracellular endonuclease n=1 Tax=Microbulbifer celer TaxID=435905 RepID=A0ABW3U8H1_9GAMM|nr:ExeM/NucH family extracellular endonuclease [Microbulbifer celer]UFN57037.1 ExeM/NucH family extracellular endonuclease [Microbulbifer celer]